ncbi:MAG: hypothetical protein R2911_06115 [Caldilineaceae bacterium]
MEPLLQRIQKVAPLSQPLRLSLRNTFRRKGRLARSFRSVLGDFVRHAGNAPRYLAEGTI